MDEYILNEHNKEEFPPAHTAEHLLNQTMIRIFGCERSYNAHVERKKSKMSFYLDHKPTRQEEKEIERQMQQLIADLRLYEWPHAAAYLTAFQDIIFAYSEHQTAEIGTFLQYWEENDVCPCIGRHVRSTAQIGRFEMLGTNWDEHEHSFRVRFKIVQ